MSFQAYLDTIEAKTGLTPRRLVELAHDRGFDQPGVKAAAVVEWLAADYGLGRGHAMALWRVITQGDRIDATHVGSEGSHRDASDRLWLDGVATKPEGY